VGMRLCGCERRRPWCGLRNDNAVLSPWEPAISGVFAVLDWVAVARRQRIVEWVCKPLVMLALIAVALALKPDSAAERSWFVAALVCALAGDVFLMLPPNGMFVPGLGAFLLAHLAYVAGFVALGLSLARVLGALEVVAVVGVIVGLPILRPVGRSHPELRGPVIAYMAAISAMAVAAAGTGRWLAGVGAALFYASDGLIAWNRFVRARPGDKVAIIVTYHLAQFALVASLVR
jgi:uncharacterized membrane protein YhhN